MMTAKQNMEGGKRKPHKPRGSTLTPKLSNTDTFSNFSHVFTEPPLAIATNYVDNEDLIKHPILRISFDYLYTTQYIRISVSGMMVEWVAVALLIEICLVGPD